MAYTVGPLFLQEQNGAGDADVVLSAGVQSDEL